MINRRKNITTILVVVMLFAQLGLAHHNSVHIIDHNYSHAHVHDHSNEHDNKEHNDSSDCQICHLTDSLKSLDLIEKANVSTFITDQYGAFIAVYSTEQSRVNYKSRAPPATLI